MAKRTKTKYPGVYERKIVDRSGHVDVAYDMVFRHEGKIGCELTKIMSHRETRQGRVYLVFIDFQAF